MDELDFNPDEFVFSEMWLVAEAGHEDAALTGHHYLGGPLEGGSRGAFLFSDRDLADRFIIQTGLAGQVVPTQFPSLAEFARFLKVIRSEGITCLVLDPAGNMERSERYITIAQALQGIENARGEPE